MILMYENFGYSVFINIIEHNLQENQQFILLLISMYYIIQYGILITICSYLVLTYASSHVSIHIKFWSILTWVLNFSLALLVPEDVYLTILNPSQQTPQYRERTYVAYQYLILYWFVYALTWTIIPVLQEWQNSGDLKSKDRLSRSLRVNGIFYVQMLIGGVIIVWILWYFQVGSEMGLVVWLKCLATVWGIFLQIIMMGYSLVQIPRSLWLQANHQRYLKYCYIQIEYLKGYRSQTLFNLKEINSKIIVISKTNFQNLSAEDRQQIELYCQNSMKMIPQSLRDRMPTDPYYFLKTISHNQDLNKCLGISNYAQNEQSEVIQSKLTKRGKQIIQVLIECHRLTKTCLNKFKRSTIQLDQMLNTSILYQNTVDNKGMHQGSQQNITQRLSHFWLISAKPFFLKTIAILFSIFGCIILISQTQVFLASSQSSSSLLGWIIKIENIQLIRILVFITIAFISYLVYYSLFSLKLFDTYGLYKHHSNGPSLMFATINFSRVGVAIVLNFFDMIKLQGIYTQVMGTVKMGLIGQWIIKGLPGVLWLIVLCHYMDLWGRLIQSLRLSSKLKFHSHKLDKNQEEEDKQINEKLFDRYSYGKEEVNRYRKQKKKDKNFKIYNYLNL